MAFAFFQILGNELSLIEWLQSWDIGLAKISGPSFRNLPDKLSIPVAFDGFNYFKIFNIIQEMFQKIQYLTLNGMKLMSDLLKFGDLDLYKTRLVKCSETKIDASQSLQ